MLRRGDVPDEINIVYPGELGRIFRAGNEKSAFRQAARRFEEESFQRGLPIGGVGTDVGETGSILFDWGLPPMHGSVDGERAA